MVYVLLGGGLGSTVSEVICGQLLEGNLSSRLPQLHEAHVVQDASQPPAHGLWFAQPLDRTQGHDEDVLNGGLGLKRCPMALKQDPKAHGVAQLGSLSKLFVTQHRALLLCWCFNPNRLIKVSCITLVKNSESRGFFRDEVAQK